MRFLPRVYSWASALLLCEEAVYTGENLEYNIRYLEPDPGHLKPEYYAYLTD